MENVPTNGSTPAHTNATEPYERLPVLGKRNGFTARQMYDFARSGLRVSRPLGRKLVVSKQSWLDGFLASKVTEGAGGVS